MPLSFSLFCLTVNVFLQSENTRLDDVDVETADNDFLARASRGYIPVCFFHHNSGSFF